MFSCCLPTSGGSGSQEPRGGRFFQCCRHWLQHRCERVRVVIRRRRQVTRRRPGQAPCAAILGPPSPPPQFQGTRDVWAGPMQAGGRCRVADSRGSLQGHSDCTVCRGETGFLRSSYLPWSHPEALQPHPFALPREGGCRLRCGVSGWRQLGVRPSRGARPGTEASCLAAGHCLHRAPPGTWGASGRKGSSAPPPPGAGRCPAQLTEASKDSR